jgi:glutamyl-tRNA(Gln) amidotransferase subunit D
MAYPAPIAALLDRAKAKAGDRIRVTARGGTYEGIAMPHHAFSGEDVLTLKLDSGYNIGIAVGDVKAVELVERHEAVRKAIPTVPVSGTKPLIAFLGTGGTIASYVDYRTGAVHPAVTAEELVFSVPELLDVCDVRTRVVFSVYSENLTPAHWQTLAREVAKEFADGAHAVIVPHGTDTMGHTAAALSFMVRDLPGPVVLVGAQRSADRPSSDAAMNLLCAAHLARADLGEVVVVMHGETSDTFCTVHRGTKVRKMHSSRRDAHRTLNDRPLGTVTAEGEVALRPDVRPRAAGPPTVDADLNPNVALLHFYPGMAPDVLRAVLDASDGVVLAGTGLGHVASDVIPLVAEAIRGGTPVVMTTQCLQGRVGLRVYDTGRDLLKAGVIPGEDMLPETATVKLMWVLGHTTDGEEVARLMRRDVAGEINPHIRLDEWVGET